MNGWRKPSNRCVVSPWLPSPHEAAKRWINRAVAAPCGGSWRPMPSSRGGISTGSFHTPSNLVVAHWPSEVESTAPLDFLLRHGLWTPFGCPMSCKIKSIISATCDFTTKSDGIWNLLSRWREIPAYGCRQSTNVHHSKAVHPTCVLCMPWSTFCLYTEQLSSIVAGTS